MATDKDISHWHMTEEDPPPGYLPSYMKGHTERLNIGELKEMLSSLKALDRDDLTQRRDRERVLLSVQRSFLHYLIATVVCNVSVSNASRDGGPTPEEDLKNKVRRLRDDNLTEFSESFRDKYIDNGELNKQLLEIRRWAVDYYKYRQAIENPPKKRDDHQAVTISFPENLAEPRIPQRYRANFKKAYNDLGKGVKYYQAGRKFTTEESLFCALCEDDCKRRIYEEQAKGFAADVVNKDVAAGRSKWLPHYSKDDPRRKNTIIAGVLASGKSYFIRHFLKESGRDSERRRREDYALIDMDEWRQVLLYTDRESLDSVIWNSKDFDECRLVRNKVLEEMKRKMEAEAAPNIVYAGSKLRENTLKILTTDDVPTDVYLYYCEPEQALLNAQLRLEAIGRHISTEKVLKSAENPARALRSVLRMISDHTEWDEDRGGNVPVPAKKHLEVIVEDTTHARVKPSSRIFSASHDSAIIYDVCALGKLQMGRHINPKVKVTHAMEKPEDHIYKPSARQAAGELKIMLHPHTVFYHSSDPKHAEQPYITYKAPNQYGIRSFEDFDEIPEKQRKALEGLDNEFTSRGLIHMANDDERKQR